MIEAPDSPGAFFVPETPHSRAENRLKLPQYIPMKRQIQQLNVLNLENFAANVGNDFVEILNVFIPGIFYICNIISHLVHKVQTHKHHLV